VAPLDPSTFLQVVLPVASAGVAGGAAFGVVRRVRAGDAYTGLGRPFAGVAAAFAALAVTYALFGSLDADASELVTLVVFVVAGPWFVFALRYAGRGHVLRRRWVVVGGVALLVGALGDMWLSFPETVALPVSGDLFTPVFGLLVLLILAGVLGVSGLVLAATWRHKRLSVGHGVVAVLPAVEPVFVLQLLYEGSPLVDDLLVAGLFVVAAVVCVVGPRWYGLVDDPPGVEHRGQRVGLTETGAAVFVADADDRVVHANAAARTAFGEVDRLPEATDAGFETLAGRETVSCWTRTGRRRFDPRVTPVRDEFGETLGATVALIDVTDREIRRQRLEVLNRVLRHNVRNQLDVIAAHAETADLPAVVDSVDRIRALSAEARRVESLVGRDRSAATATDLAAFVDRVVDDAVPDRGDRVTVDVPSVTIELDRALCRYALSELLENAVEHGGEAPTVVVRGRETATGSRLVVADDGPGIPANERAVIDAESETALSHGSSLGLWGVQWAVQTLGGSLSFEESDLGGTAVALELPDRGAPPADDDAPPGNDTADDDTPVTTDDDETSGEEKLSNEEKVSDEGKLSGEESSPPERHGRASAETESGRPAATTDSQTPADTQATTDSQTPADSHTSASE
jgi:signal transduction histidine kinase